MSPRRNDEQEDHEAKAAGAAQQGQPRQAAQRRPSLSHAYRRVPRGRPSGHSSSRMVCTPRPMRPCSPCNTLSATPTPMSAAYDVPSSPTHSPTGSSVQRDGQVRVDEREAFAVDGHPHAVAEVGHRRDPLQAATAARRRSRAPASGTTRRSARPRGAPETTDRGADLDRVPEAERASLGEGERRRSAGRRERRDVAGRGEMRRRRGSTVRIRSAVARTTSVSSANSDPCTICTFFPGRIMVRSTRRGESGTGRIRSMVSRAVKSAGPGSKRSSSPASSADGAPPCCACGDHGPRAISVGIARSPSR